MYGVESAQSTLRFFEHVRHQSNSLVIDPVRIMRSQAN